MSISSGISTTAAGAYCGIVDMKKLIGRSSNVDFWTRTKINTNAVKMTFGPCGEREIKKFHRKNDSLCKENSNKPHIDVHNDMSFCIYRLFVCIPRLLRVMFVDRDEMHFN